MRLQYPSNIRIIRVPCSGEVSQNILFKSFEIGIDGVIVAGCIEGNCHYLQGNCRAKKRVEMVKDVLDQIGLDSRRVELYHLSSGMGRRFAEIATEMTDRILQLGPNPYNRGITK